MLIALLCLNNDTKELDVSFLQIHSAQSTDSMKPRGGAGYKAAVLGSFLPETEITEFEHFARLAQKLCSNTTYVLFKSCTPGVLPDYFFSSPPGFPDTGLEY